MKAATRKILWSSEFGSDYGVPSWVDKLIEEGTAEDNSWHHDVYPHFVISLLNGKQVRLWVNHIDKAKRDIDAQDAPRFMFYEGNDEDEMSELPYFTTDSEKEAKAHLSEYFTFS
jgi:hypothetical protein